MNRCKAHPTYKARRKPGKTVGHPDGCPTCWTIWEEAGMNGKAPGIVITPEEARAYVYAIQALKRTPEPVHVQRSISHTSSQPTPTIVNVRTRVNAQHVALLDRLLDVLIGIAKG